MDYVISFNDLYKKPKPKRAKKAVGYIKKYFYKHKRLMPNQVLISNEVNEKLWGQGMYHIPRQIEVELIFHIHFKNI